MATVSDFGEEKWKIRFLIYTFSHSKCPFFYETIYIMSAAIEEAISNHNKVLVSVLEQLKEVNSKYACVDPEDLRNRYDIMSGIIETKTIEIKERKDYIKKCIKDLEKCNEPIAEMEKVFTPFLI